MNYGKTTDYPLMVNGISDSYRLMEGLLCSDGFNIFFHRCGSTTGFQPKPLDHYQVMKSDLSIHDLYIYCYAEETRWHPPDGFLFDSTSFSPMMNISKTHFFLQDIDESKLKSGIGKYILQNVGSFGKVRNFPIDLIDQGIKEYKCHDFKSESIFKQIKSVRCGTKSAF